MHKPYDFSNVQHSKFHQSDLHDSPGAPGATGAEVSKINLQVNKFIQFRKKAENRSYLAP